MRLSSSLSVCQGQAATYAGTTGALGAGDRRPWRFAQLKLQMVLGILGFEEDLRVLWTTKFHQWIVLCFLVGTNSLFGISHLLHQIRWHDTVFTSLG